MVPALFGGTMEGVAEGSVVAVAVRGRVEATTRVYRAAASCGSPRSSARARCGRGADRITVLAVDGQRMRTLATAG